MILSVDVQSATPRDVRISPRNDFFEVRVEGPALLPRSGVDGEDYVEWRGEVKCVAGEDGCGFKGCVVEAGAMLIERVGVEGPGRVQVGKVLARYLSGGGVARASGIATVGGPSLRRELRLKCRKDQQAMLLRVC